MSDLNVAFWNVHNLFAPGAVLGRGPQDQAEYDAKLQVTAGVIDSFFGGAGPDLLGLAEVGDRHVLDELIRRSNRLKGKSLVIWEPEGARNQTGLALVVRDDRFADLRLLDAYRTSARPHSLIVRCELRTTSEPFLVAVNHWKSRMRPQDAGRRERRKTAEWLRDRIASRPERCSIVIGDFNAEPFEAELGEKRLCARRRFRQAIRKKSQFVNLYNTAWRFLAEADPWEDACVPGYAEPRPTKTHDSSCVFDQLLVSGPVLRGGFLRLKEKSVQLFADPPAGTRVNGILQPRRWERSGPGNYEGSSDHFPLLASFHV